MSDHQLISDILKELDAVLGCATRRWVKDAQVMPHAHPASFYLNGVSVGSTAATANTTVWRFTPNGMDGVEHNVSRLVSKFKGSSIRVGPVTYDDGTCSLIFVGGSVLAVKNPQLAPYGVWISQDSAADVHLDCLGRSSPTLWPPT